MMKGSSSLKEGWYPQTPEELRAVRAAVGKTGQRSSIQPKPQVPSATVVLSKTRSPVTLKT